MMFVVCFACGVLFIYGFVLLVVECRLVVAWCHYDLCVVWLLCVDCWLLLGVRCNLRFGACCSLFVV